MKQEQPQNPAAGPQHGYWKSLGELAQQTDADSAEARELRDLNDGVAEATNGGGTIDPLSRRNFFHVMGASLALAGVAGPGCKRYEKDEIVPLSRRPEDQVPGNAQLYTSAFELGGVVQPLVVTSYEGRPIKVDGNPDHPFAAGNVVEGTKKHAGSTAFAQASILNLYDPDRSKAPAAKGGKGATLEAVKTALQDALAKAGSGAKLRILAEAISSPTLAALRRELQSAKFPEARWYEYEPVSLDNEREGLKLAFGRVVRPMLKLDKAATIVALENDLFVEHPAALRHSRDFGRSRNPEKSTLGVYKMNRLWVAESYFSATGASADHRLPVRSEHIAPIAMALDSMVSGGISPSSELLKEPKVSKWVSVLASELKENMGKAVVVCGRNQPPAVHALVAKINQAIGAVGNTIEYVEDPQPERVSHLEAIAALSKEMASGLVETLIILGGNPVFDAPVDVGFADALTKVAHSFHLSEYNNETSQQTTWHIPRAHYLEAWGDGRTWDGTITLAQPLIVPLYGGLSAIEFISLVMGQEATGDKLIQNTLASLGHSLGWRKFIHDGFVPNSALPTASVTANAPPLPPLTATQKAGSRLGNGQLEVVFVPSGHTYDGRFANNAWLQETPDFMTKVTWDNYALVSPDAATEFGLKNDTLIKVTVDGRDYEVACYTMPGQARHSIGLVLGGGRTAAGNVGGNSKKKVGFNPYICRSTKAFHAASGANVAGTGKKYELANTQEHWDMQAGINKAVGKKGTDARLPQIVREATHEQYSTPGYEAVLESEYFKDDANGRGLSIFKEHVYKGHSWGMAIDLGNCTGCNACVVACQSENNIPVVGKEQVFNNREMNWMRIDRYFKGPVDDPEMISQQVACQQCEMAPCEQVCPVGATVHSDEGLNDMSYNRCVGTRYCLNNCPYRARRFNFFDYNEQYNEARNKVRQLIFNPEVTVRERGVMEKCTYCVQRIQNGKISAKRDGRTLADGDIVTACQSACPSEAIVFGDYNDPKSRLVRLTNDRRSYGLLDELIYTKPRTRYLAKVRNPHPAMVPAAAAGAAHGGH